jgi:hypothetical protein
MVGRQSHIPLKTKLPTPILGNYLAHFPHENPFESDFYLKMGNFPSPMGCFGSRVWLILGACRQLEVKALAQPEWSLKAS